MKYIFEQRDSSFYGRFNNIGFGFLIICTWILLITSFFSYMDPPTPPDFFEYVQVKQSILHVIFFKCISAPLWEEVVFRWWPIYMVRKLSLDYQIPTILASCAIFGYLHGSASNVWIQGVTGLIIACVYIKNNYHYWSAVILHSLWNFMVVFGFHLLSS